MSTKFLIIVLSFVFLLPNNGEAALPGTTYEVTDPREGSGLFSTFHDVIGALDFYDKKIKKDRNIGLIVDFGKKGLFYDPTLGENWWNYYFKDIHLGKLNGKILKFPSYKKSVFAWEAEFGLSRDRYAELIKKYVFLEPSLQQEVDTFIKEHFKDSYVIGVHYRGTDKKSEAPTLTYEAVGDRISKDMTSLPQKKVKIFIATDEEKFLQYAKERFPGKVISSNAIRSKDEKPVHSSQLGTPYQRGKDAVLDCWLLAACNKLYQMASNLSDAAANMNPKMQVVRLNKSYFEDTVSDTYGVATALNAILALLNRYEKGEVKGVHALFPTQEGSKIYPPGNWWKNHFMPVKVGNTNGIEPMPFWQMYNRAMEGLFEIPRGHARVLLEKYIKPKPEIIKKVNEFMSKTKRPLIGVHYYKQPGLSPEQVQQIPSYSSVLDKLKKQKSNQQLLVVTNDSKFFDAIYAQYPDMISYYRPIEGQSVERLEEEERMLIQAILLSKTDKVIGTASIMLKMAGEFNSQLLIDTLDKLWLEKP